MRGCGLVDLIGWPAGWLADVVTHCVRCTETSVAIIDQLYVYINAELAKQDTWIRL